MKYILTAANFLYQVDDEPFDKDDMMYQDLNVYLSPKFIYPGSNKWMISDTHVEVLIHRPTNRIINKKIIYEFEDDESAMLWWKLQ